jgi:hypothetical protein
MTRSLGSAVGQGHEVSNLPSGRLPVGPALRRAEYQGTVAVCAVLRTVSGRWRICCSPAALDLSSQSRCCSNISYLILNRSRARAPNLRPIDRIIASLCLGLTRPARLLRSAIVLQPSTLMAFHRALVNRKYRLLFAPKRRRKPGCFICNRASEPQGQSNEVTLARRRQQARNAARREKVRITVGTSRRCLCTRRALCLNLSASNLTGSRTGHS